MALRIEVLGPLRVTSDVELALTRSSHRRLLSILALDAGRRIATDVLIDRFWGEAAPPTARAALQTHVSALRKSLPAELVVTEGYGYRLALDGHELDAAEFLVRAGEANVAAEVRDWAAALQAVEAASALWRGRPYAELEDDDFARSEIARLEELHLELQELRAESLLGLGRSREALPELERLVVEHPLRERLWEHLMTARYREGRHAEALAAYRDAWEAFAELGLEPSAALRGLERKILRHAEDLAGRARHNLPIELTRFVGREQELDDVAGLLDEHRLVTLTGVGGSGKTRLALRVAGRVLEAFPDGCWLAELAPLRDPGLVPLEVASAVGLRPEAGDVAAALSSAIGGDTALIVLDNCEHLDSAPAEISRLLLESGPHIRILATSREPLRAPGEVLFDVPPMAFPDDGDLDPETLESFDAVRLFEERAGHTRPSFTVDAANAGAVLEICRRLDGIPLAIELAAARTGSLTPEAIATHLDDSLRILTGGASTAPARHQTLAAAFAWSYDLLDEPERLLFGRLSVFSGGFTLEMAAEVGAGDGVEAADVVALTAALVEKSLVFPYEAPGGQRYRLLEPLHDYAAARVEEAGAAGALGERHLVWCTGFAASVVARVFGGERRAALERLASESDNLQAALDRSPASVLAQALAWHWWEEGYLQRSISCLETALERCGEIQAEAELRAHLGMALFAAGEGGQAFDETTRAYELAAGLGSWPARWWVLLAHARLHLLLVDRGPSAAVPLSRDALAEADAAGDSYARVLALRGLGRALAWNGELDDGLDHHRRALDVALRGGDPATALETYQSFYDLLYLHPVARRDEPRRLTGEMVARFPPDDPRWAKHVTSDWLPYVFLQSGEWDRAEEEIDRLGRRHLEGYDRIGLLMTHATLRWMQGRFEEARADLDELRELGVNPRWYHDYYPLLADLGADEGRLAAVRQVADAYLSLDVHPSEEARKLGVLSPLARAEADAALASSGQDREAHAERVRATVARGQALLEEFPPTTQGALQMETPATYLALAEAELSRVADADPALWRRAVDLADYFHFRLYARRRLCEALVQTGRGAEAEPELRTALADAAQAGAEHARRRLAALARRAGLDPAGSASP